MSSPASEPDGVGRTQTLDIKSALWYVWTVTMNINMNTEPVVSPGRQAVINGLAIFGFLALITAGIWLAIYSTRFVPTAVNRIGAAAVYLGSVFTPAPDSTLSVVSTPTTPASTTIPFGTGAATPANTTSAAQTPDTQPTTPIAGQPINTTYQVGGSTASAPYGLSDLSVTVDERGYLATKGSLESFVASSTVPNGKEPAVKFTVRNIGTNWTGTWRFNASIPNRMSTVREFDPQSSLAPGGSVAFVLGFDQAKTGSGQILTITLNPDKSVSESSTSNNSAIVQLDIL